MATPTIPDWPAYTDDDLVTDNGTDITAAFLDSLGNAIQDSITGADNPSIYASTIIDEVIAARGGYSDLDERLDQPVVGTINTGVNAADIVDEVVTARDDNPDLNDRLDNFVADEIPDSTTSVRGLLNDGATAQIIDGDKDFTGALTFVAGTSAEELSPVGQLRAALDLTARTTSGTSETDLSTYTLPANVLARNGQCLVIRTGGKYDANGNNKRSAVYFNGAEIIHHPNNAVNNAGYYTEVRIYRLTASTQVAFARTVLGDPGSVNSANQATATVYYTAHWDNLTADLTASIAIKTTSTAAVAGTNTQYFFEVTVEG